MKDTKALRQGAPQGPAQDHMLLGKGVGDFAYTPPRCLFSKLLLSQGPMPGSRWGRAGAASSRETGSQDVQIAREQSSPFVARKIPSLPGSLSPSNLSSKSDLGDCRGLGCHLNAPFPSCPLPQGLLHLPPKPPRYDFPSLMGGPRAQTQV